MTPDGTLNLTPAELPGLTRPWCASWPGKPATMTPDGVTPRPSPERKEPPLGRTTPYER